MAKIKTLKKQKKSPISTLKEFKPNPKLLLDKKLVASVLVDAILENDIDTFRDVLISHLRTLSKTELAKSTGLGRRTLYDLMDAESFDPRISTLSSLLSKIAA